MERLPDALVDQIAAGEVVERPASVVKELLENAVDAGARRIRVEIRDGGRALVAVGDDGVGMSAADAELALERHATSKLRRPEDLQRIGSFGFRGEALPAIASVSRLRLRTRARGADEGVEIRVDHGRREPTRAAGGPEGTRIEVADLFAGVPARRKFLKAASTEWGHVSDVLARTALALPGIHFDVQRDERRAFAWPASDDPRDRIAAVLSDRDAAGLVAAREERHDLRLEAWVSRPDLHRPTAAGIHLFVNGRPVRDRLLRHALLSVYRDWLPRGRFPTALLYLTLPPEAVDVNVHPAKWEVRFADPQAIHRLLTDTLRSAIGSRGWVGGAAPAAPTGAPQPWPVSASPAHSAGSSAGDWIFAEGRGAAAEPGPEHAPVSAPSPELRAGPGRVRFAEMRLVGQLLATYLVLEDKSGLVLVDQHAAHERVLYERLRAAWLEGGVERQALLLPITVELEPAAAAALVADPEAALGLGFEVEAFGEATVALRAVPALLADRDPEGLVRDLAEELRAGREGGATREASQLRMLPGADRLFATLACHSARRAGEQLDAREQQALLEALDEIPWAPTCPHGRPVALPVSVAEIERRFGRA